MQLEATLNLEDLTAAEIAEFEMKCQKKKASPEKQTSALIRDFISPDKKPAGVRKLAKRRAMKK